MRHDAFEAFLARVEAAGEKGYDCYGYEELRMGMLARTFYFVSDKSAGAGRLFITPRGSEYLRMVDGAGETQ